MEFTGRLSVFPAGSLLQWAATERAAGTLVIRRGQREKRVQFHEGKIVTCRSNAATELFGQYLLAHGYLDSSALMKALTFGRAKKVPLGVAVAGLKLLPLATVREALERSVRDSVQDLLLWNRGVFYFEEGAPPPEGAFALVLDPRELLLEGTHWVDEHARIRKVFVDDGTVLRRGPAAPRGDLGAFESRIVAGVAPEASLRDLYQKVGGVKFPFLTAAYRLTLEKVLEIARNEPDRDTGSRELDLRTLLLSIEAPDEVVVGSDRAIFPLEAIESLVPIWVRPPSERDLSGLGVAQRGFLEGIDGRLTLRRLLAEDLDLRADQIELLLVELKRRNVVLLPAALEDVERRMESDSPLRRLVRRWKS